MEQGWIKLYRKTFENPVVMKDADHLAVWVWLLGHATFRPYDILVGNTRTTLQPGQLRVSRETIAAELCISSSKVQRILKLFESEQLIEQLMNSRSRVISIVSWVSYQESEQLIEQQVNSSWTAREQHLNANKNIRTIRTKELKKYRLQQHTTEQDGTTDIWGSLSNDDVELILSSYENGADLIDQVHEEVKQAGRVVRNPLKYVRGYAEQKGWPESEEIRID